MAYSKSSQCNHAFASICYMRMTDIHFSESYRCPTSDQKTKPATTPTATQTATLNTAPGSGRCVAAPVNGVTLMADGDGDDDHVTDEASG